MHVSACQIVAPHELVWGLRERSWVARQKYCGSHIVCVWHSSAAWPATNQARVTRPAAQVVPAGDQKHTHTGWVRFHDTDRACVHKECANKRAQLIIPPKPSSKQKHAAGHNSRGRAPSEKSANNATHCPHSHKVQEGVQHPHSQDTDQSQPVHRPSCTNPRDHTAASPIMWSLHHPAI